ncbi:MAG: deoxyribodipyrimidine photo-lyase [Gammaproteobacteria bacterium]|nr:deoxyribodipyrimidine photo-lyase [Gammaproteobacteria bacterium]MBV9696540.1 deoxyribodipyrimidine photo-lyase [Gammaproteobacteria bacterium]
MPSSETEAIERERICELNGAPERRGRYVLYWMQQSQRAQVNPALELAILAANRLHLPVLVAFGLTDDFPGANARHYAFMLQGLTETAGRLRERGVAFTIRRGAPDAVILALAPEAALIVCDHGYLRIQKEWRTRVAAGAGVRVVRVEGDLLVPRAAASGARELGARTLRPKLARLRERYLRRPRSHRPQVSGATLAVASDLVLDDPRQVLDSLKVDRSVGPVESFTGGYSQARARLKAFVGGDLKQYVSARACPGQARVSHLSAYLHFGQISPIEVALAVRDADAPEEARTSFLEELLVRRELAANFVDTTPDYDRYESVPEWAQRSLAAHAKDPRPHRYDYDTLARAATHDPYWNAAMREMLTTGYMHNHMRMYWGKKVLEWSATPGAGYAHLLQLNNTYFLDGRDPSSFANVGWVFGLHDRPWPERPIFGTVRYMNAAGLERKTDIKVYTAKWGGEGGQGALAL